MRTIGNDNLPAGSTIHKFEAAGLGKAPYQFTGCEVMTGPITLKDGSQVGSPGQPMGTCQFCGTGIKDAYWLKSSDGKEFYVGCDCIRKAGDKGLMKVVSQREKEKRQAKAEARRQKQWAAAAKVREQLKGLIEVHAELLSSKPHPMGFGGLTLLNYVEYMVTHAGHSGWVRAIGLIEKEIA